MEPLSVPATLESLHAIREYVAAAAAAAGLDPKAAYRLRLSADELATNVVVHGFRAERPDERIVLRAEVDDRALTLVMEDRAPAFDPRQAPLPERLDLPLEERTGGGLGIFLALANVDEFSYERVGDRNRNIMVVHRKPGAPPAPSGPPVPRATEDDQVQGNLLVADGSLAHRDDLLRELRQLGYTVDVAADGRQALEILAARKFDVLLLGLETPQPSGYEVLERLKADPALRSVPVLIVSTTDDPDAGIARCIELGAADFVREPFSPALLRSRVAACLARGRLREEEAELKKLERFSDVMRNVILPLGIALSMEKNLDRLLERILREAKAFCNADAGTLYVRTRDDRLKFAIMLTDSLHIALGGTTGKEIPFPPLRLYDPTTGEPNFHNVATNVALRGESINIPDIYRAERFDFSATKLFDARNNYRSISTLTVPLKNNADEVVAVLQLLNAQDSATGEVIPFDSFQQLVVESLSSQAAVAFNNQLLLQREQELLKFERDLQIGRQIQLGFLPQQLPQPVGLEIAGYFQPAREVAGDFYDAFELPSGAIGFVIADVCDKGVGPALFMALVRSLMRAFTYQRCAPASGDGGGSVDPQAVMEVMELTNNYINENHTGMNMFATVFFAVLDPQSGAVTYANGGHNPPAILGRDGRVRARLAPTGPAVGVMPGFDFGVKEARLEPGEILFAFSDGIPDARDPEGDFFTEKRMVGAVEEFAPGHSAADLLAGVREAVTAHIATAAQYDDITMLAARRLPR